MIVVDENLHDQRLMTAIAGWYHGQAVALPKERIREVPTFLQRLFRLPGFKTKALRMAKVVRLSPNYIEYYESDRKIQSFLWPE